MFRRLLSIPAVLVGVFGVAGSIWLAMRQSSGSTEEHGDAGDSIPPADATQQPEQ
jgi:hypothetical protein